MIFCKVNLRLRIFASAVLLDTRLSVISVMLPSALVRRRFQGSFGQRVQVGLYEYSPLIEMLMAGYTNAHTHPLSAEITCHSISCPVFTIKLLLF